MGQITISEGLSWAKTLKARHDELVSLRNENGFHERIFFRGANADKTTEKTPVYDIKKLDALVTQVAKEMRLLDAALKKTNATVNVVGYDQNDAVLGQVE